MRAGQMRQRVDIQNPVTQTDSTGQDTFVYYLSASGYPAMVRNVTQTKSESGVIQNSGQETYEIVMRFTPMVDYNTRFIYQGRVLSVTQIEDHAELRHGMKIRAEAVDL
jgi:SPP1 family predicted phage head-tail adaptor